MDDFQRYCVVVSLGEFSKLHLSEMFSNMLCAVGPFLFFLDLLRDCYKFRMYYQSSISISTKPIVLKVEISARIWTFNARDPHSQNICLFRDEKEGVVVSDLRFYRSEESDVARLIIVHIGLNYSQNGVPSPSKRKLGFRRKFFSDTLNQILHFGKGAHRDSEVCLTSCS